VARWLRDPGPKELALPRGVPTSPGWRFVLLVVIGAAVVRAAAIVVYPSGGADLEIYVYFGRLLLHGDNPYDAPAGGIIPPRYEDHPVGEFALFDVFGRLDVREAVVLSFAASIVLLPESTRVEWIALAMLLITRLTTARIAVIWCASLVGFATEVLHSDRFTGRCATFLLARRSPTS
jgi:hypothetical protein